MVKRVANTRAMEEALEDAVARMGNGGAASGASSQPASVDPIGLLMAALPKLLQNGPAQDELAERLDSIEKDELQPIRVQLAAQSKMLERVYQAEKVLLRELRQVQQDLRASQQVQGAVGAAIDSLAAQLERIELVEDGADSGEVCEGPKGVEFRDRTVEATGKRQRLRSNTRKR